MLNKEHIHELQRTINKRGDKIWRCGHPDCFFKAGQAFVLGKRSICCKCHTNVFILDGERIRRKRPVCDECSWGPKAKERYEKAKQFQGIAKDMFNDIIGGKVE
jgi:hypothetical protein